MQGRESVLKKLMEDLFQHIVPVNEGYDYLFSDEVYIPVYDTTLLVTKRIVMPISLVEEKVLQLIDVGVYQIDEISQILGLKRKLLDITLADLYSKDLVMVTSNSCKLMKSGRNALTDLCRAEKKQDVLRNVCIDGILGNVIDSSLYELMTNVYDDNGKLKPMLQTGNVNNYIEQFDKISLIFDEENVIFYSEGVKPTKEELLKIDKVESTFVKYIKIPIHIYVSSNGVDIDVVQILNKHKELLELYKDYIIEQINNKKVLKKHFKYIKISQQGYDGEVFEEKPDLYDELKKIHFTQKKNIDYSSITSDVIRNRKLSDGEYKDILKYIISQSSDVELYVDNLDDWAYDKQFRASLADILKKSRLSIYYMQSNDIVKAKNQINRDFERVRQYIKTDKKYFICWKAGSYMLYGLPELRKVIDDKTECLCISYYLQVDILLNMK